MRILSGQKAETALRKVEQRGAASLATVEIPVRRIVEDVRDEGDRALRRYAQKWDGMTARQPIRVPQSELKQAWESTSVEFRKAVRTAADNIKRYCELQRPREFQDSFQPGIRVGQVVRPLESAGCYVPGGRYPLPSTMLMTVIPAQVAGVKKICVVSPRPAPATLGTAFFLGVEEFYRVGGAQAIAALAYGTKSIPRVDKIVGPGNLYVTAAKKIVAFDCAIDFLAGPTEIVVVSHAGEPRFIAADLVAQAEHDLDAIPLFITASKQLAESVKLEVAKATRENEIAADAVARNGLILLAASREQAMEFANRIAPEHITVEEEDLPLVQNAGSIFVGDYSPQAGGDYAVGPNHVLPTGAAARFRGGLSIADFLKIISVQQLTKQGVQQLASAIITLAEAEGLKAHAESVRVRCAHA
jgi:histidinol dehydrogenase